MTFHKNELWKISTLFWNMEWCWPLFLSRDLGTGTCNIFKWAFNLHPCIFSYAQIHEWTPKRYSILEVICNQARESIWISHFSYFSCDTTRHFQWSEWKWKQNIVLKIHFTIQRSYGNVVFLRTVQFVGTERTFALTSNTIVASLIYLPPAVNLEFLSVLSKPCGQSPGCLGPMYWWPEATFRHTCCFSSYFFKCMTCEGSICPQSCYSHLYLVL